MSALVEPDSFGSVLVVGGCGFVGFHIVRHLLQDSSCTAIAVLSRNPNRNLLPGVSYHTGDIEDVESIQHPSVLASVYTSTSSVVAGSEHVFVDESHPVRDSTIKANDYSKTKGLVDALVLRANKPESIDGTYLRTLCIRPAGIYGGRGIQTMRNILISKQKGKSRVQLGDNSNLMDWVSVDNVASARPLAAKALLAGINNPSSPKVDGEAFVITDGAPYHSGIL
ncbi:erg26, C-3 sterol dehydrogenase [Xylographa bjoerkii]|nr:erg26, C-3 sterol dehydrogenase [Xylographa bjoerkii]